MSVSNKPLLYVISAVVPDDTKTGGEIILHRHLIERNEFQVRVIAVPPSVPRLIRSLEAGRLRTYIRAFSFYFYKADPEFFRTLPRPHAVVTVAHGRECFLAMQAAKYWDVPLVTFFHDWMEVIGNIHPRLRSLADRALRKLYHSSALALCVSRAMKEHLGPHPGATVLHPIPSNTATLGEIRSRRERPSLLYFGYCGGGYREMLNELISVCSTLPVTLRVTGPYFEDLKGDYDNVMKTGFVGPEGFADLFGAADILLVLLNFETANVKHFSTHFPSKLVEYCCKGKLIGIWGPSYSTGIQWAKETGGAFYYEKNDAQGFVSGLLEVFYNVGERNRYINRATEIGNSEFSPESIHNEFKQALAQTLQGAGDEKSPNGA